MKIRYFCIFLFLPFAIHAQAFHNSFITFRDAVYMQNSPLPETMRLYTAAKQDIDKIFTDTDLYLSLSRCECLMGISFWAESRNSEAAAYFEQGIAWAEKSIELRPTSEGYRLLGTNISVLCDVRRSYGLTNFGKIEENARKALELDPNNLMAKYLIASRYVAAPWPLADVRKGVALLDEITRQNYLSLEKEDIFSLYIMLEAACLKQKKNQEAKIWHDKAMTLYPTNNFINLILK